MKLQAQQWTFESLMRLFNMTAIHDVDSECLYWRVDNGILHMFIKCNDLFWWACSDCEEIIPDNLDLLEQSLVDVKNICDKKYLNPDLGTLLFCARMRNKRPQGSYYEMFPPGVRELFDAAGPERSLDESGNTPVRDYSWQWTSDLYDKKI